MDHIRQFLGAVCDHTWAKRRELYLGCHGQRVSRLADLCGCNSELTQFFLVLSAFGIPALIVASSALFLVLKAVGAGLLIYLGIRGWRTASQPVPNLAPDLRQLYLRAFMLATINPKSVAGYLAAFSQFIQSDLPVMSQMWVIVPTALSLTTLSYVGYCALGAGLGRTALNAVFNASLRRIMAVCFILYGLLLGTSHFSKGA